MGADIVPEHWEMVNPKDKLSVFQRLRWLYFQFSLVTCTFMLDPWERRLADVCFLTVLAIVSYACYVYLPPYALQLFQIVKLLSPAAHR
ncbi:hypothetical protein RvY_03691 [Ramazzottius varieornatus]|uniref:Serine palmitoyltransferase small subunit B n=1 Tax=Ramazzottius varieornatus TaxID=947166 RepID=A0A1D1USE4_RAMVA|nr:hypothetical protein RvY_03691 [Ramazzottius varieornatus]